MTALLLAVRANVERDSLAGLWLWLIVTAAFATWLWISGNNTRPRQ